jgi:prepilin-type N-terminal cleavage/methylation domain-containing protein
MRRHGFTLIELIVVIAIIAILAAIVAPRAFLAIEKSKVAKAYMDYRAVKGGCMSLNSDTGSWPHGYNSAVRVIDSDLMVDASGLSDWDGPYMDGFKGMNPWSGTYYFTTNFNSSGGPNAELSIEFENRCFPNGPNGGCPIPDTSKVRIDTTLDDGCITSGAVQVTPWGDFHWELVRDICPGTSCW